MSTLLSLTLFRLKDSRQLPAIGLGMFGTTGEDKSCPLPEVSPNPPKEAAT